MVGPVLVGVDGADRSADAVALGELLAGVTGAPLELVNVYPRTASEHSAEPLRAGAVEVAVAASPPGATATAVSGGSPAEGLHEHAHRRSAALIVVGSSDHGRLGRVLPGSTAERLLHGGPCAIAVAPRGFADGAPRHLGLIGVGYDAGPEADRALAGAEALACAANARLRVIAVVEPVSMRAPYAAAMYEVVMAEQREWLQRRARDARDAIGEDIGVESVVKEGSAVAELAGASRELDLLVCGSRGYGPLRAVLAGGVVGRVMREASCPVLVLPRGSGDLFEPAPAAHSLAESSR